MKARMFVFLMAATLMVLLVNCGGNRDKRTLKQRELDAMPDDVDPIAAIVGDVTPEEIKDEDENAAALSNNQEPDEDSIGGTQGAFLPTIKVSGKEVVGKYTIKTAEMHPKVVKKNLKTGKDVMLEPGSYDFHFTTDKVTGNPVRSLQGVDILAGRRVRREVKFPTGQITLTTGRRCKKSAIKIRAKGASEWIKGKFYTCKPIVLMAGEYEADKNGTAITGIQVYDGGIRDVLIRKN